MSLGSVPKLYKSVIDDVINAVREDFLDDGVDEQVLFELKQTWEKKLFESKAIDINAKETEQVSVVKTTNSKANNFRNSQSAANQKDKEQQQQQQQQQHQQSHQQNHQQQLHSVNQQQQSAHNQQQQQLHNISGASTVQLGNHQVITTNQTHINAGATNTAAATSIPSQLALQTNYVGTSGIIYTTNEPVDGQKSIGSTPKIVLLQTGLPGQHILTSTTGGALNISPELLNQIALQQGGVITHAQPTVVHHTSNVAQNAISGTIQYANSSARQPTSQANSRPVQAQSNNNNSRIVQIDGADDSSEEDEDEDDYRDNDDDHDDNDEEVNDEENEGQGEDEEPLNSEDDVSDEDATELFDTDNVVVCQYDKITRSRNKWKFHLKDGIMNLQGKDYVFQRAIGDAEW